MSLWELYKQWQGLDPDLELPTVLDAHRKTSDGLTHCTTCGGVWFVGTIAFDSDGTPEQVLTPQRCLGCGEQRKTRWPN